jgi:hypothetical protein
MAKFLRRDQILFEIETFQDEDAGVVSDGEETDCLEINRASDDDDFEEEVLEEDLNEDSKEDFEEEKKSMPVSDSKMSFSSYQSMKPQTLESSSLEKTENVPCIPVSESKMSFSIETVPTNNETVLRNNETIPTSKFFKIPPSSPKKASISDSISNFVRNTMGRHSLKSTIVRKSFKAKIKSKMSSKKEEEIIFSKVNDETKWYGKVTKAMLSKNIKPYCWDKEPQPKSFVPLEKYSSKPPAQKMLKIVKV